MKKSPPSPTPAFKAAAQRPRPTPAFKKAAANPTKPVAQTPQHNIKPPTFARGGARTANVPKTNVAAPPVAQKAKQTPKQAFAQAAAQKQVQKGRTQTQAKQQTLTQKFTKAVKR